MKAFFLKDENNHNVSISFTIYGGISLIIQ